MEHGLRTTLSQQFAVEIGDHHHFIGSGVGRLGDPLSASSPEFVGEFWLGEVSELVV